MPTVKTIVTPAFQMDYIVFGTGQKPFVILPGLSHTPIVKSAHAIATAYTDFATEYSVYVFDRKRDIREGYSVAEMAGDTAEVMKRMGLTNAYVFGASQGGMIAQKIAVEYPELIQKLVLGSTMSRLNPTTDAVITRWMAWAKAGDKRSLNRDTFQKLYSPTFLEQNREILFSLEEQGTPEELARFAVLAEACLHFDVFDQLNAIQCPVLVLGAKQDQVVTGEASLEIAGKIHCDVYMYEKYGHAVYDEAPDYKDRLKHFFNV